MNWKLLNLVFPVLFGAIGGFLYYNFIGCNGSCAITGSAYISTIYGAGIGAILVNWKSGIKSIRANETSMKNLFTHTGMIIMRVPSDLNKKL